MFPCVPRPLMGGAGQVLKAFFALFSAGILYSSVAMATSLEQCRRTRRESVRKCNTAIQKAVETSNSAATTARLICQGQQDRQGNQGDGKDIGMNGCADQ